MDLYSKIVLVTGAGVVMLVQLGMQVIIHYHHSEEGAKQTIQNLPGKKSKHLVLQTYLKDVSSIKKLLQKAEKQVGTV